MAGIAEFWYVVKINFFSFFKITMRFAFRRFWIPLNAIEKNVQIWEIQKFNSHANLEEKSGGNLKNGDLWFYLWQQKFLFKLKVFHWKKNPRRWLVRYDFFKNWKTATLELQGLSYHKLIDLMTHLLSISTLQTFFPWWKIWKFLRIGWIF